MKILILSRGSSYPQKEIIRAGIAAGHQVDVASYKRLRISFSKEIPFEIQTEDGKSFSEYDYIIPRGPLFYNHILQMVSMYAERKGIKMLNFESFNRYPIFDKSVQYALLGRDSLPIIPTSVDTVESNFEELSAKHGNPFVYKYTRGSVGMHVHKIDSQAKLDALPQREERLKQRYYIAQNFWPSGTDYRVIVIGEEVIGAMKRTAGEGEFRANYSLGGSVEAAEVTEDLRVLALSAAKSCGCDYAGIDIMYWKEKPYVIEVNRVCHFDGFDKAHNSSVAQKLIKYVESNE
jgi:RimK family alpha-L-glutamate ligase